MTASRRYRQIERRDTVLLRSIGVLALATAELRARRVGSTIHHPGWLASADRLLAASAGTMIAVSTASPGSISTCHGDAPTPTGVEEIDRLSAMISRHARVGLAFAGPESDDVARIPARSSRRGAWS